MENRTWSRSFCSTTPHPLLPQTLNVLNSITSTGHSGQLCTQHTIKSHPLGRCPCLRKLRLSFSNSIFTSCQRWSSIFRIASQSGNCSWISHHHKTQVPGHHAEQVHHSHLVGGAISHACVHHGPLRLWLDVV